MKLHTITVSTSIIQTFRKLQIDYSHNLEDREDHYDMGQLGSCQNNKHPEATKRLWYWTQGHVSPPVKKF